MNVWTYLERLRAFVEARDYAGYDPYDALNSPLLRALSLGTKWGRIACTQALRRCPVNLRPLLWIQAGQNSKALGLFLAGYVKLYRATGEAKYRERIEHLVSRLEALRSAPCSGNAWGYNFDWQSRVFYVPRGTPNIVTTAFVGHALLDAYEVAGLKQALELAAPIAAFMLKDLNRIQEGETFCFSYTPLDRYAVHNASLLGASVLIRLHRHGAAPEVRDAALCALTYSLKHQRDDGSWFYAEREGSHWIDSFHTGFNLEAIRHFLDLGEAQEHRPAYEKGVRFYADNLFLPDGTPKYYADKVEPVDIHSSCEALAFFSGLSPRYDELCARVAGWLVRNLYDEKRGYFHFRKTRWLKNRIPYMRWGQAWAFHGLTAYAFRRKTPEPSPSA